MDKETQIIHEKIRDVARNGIYVNYGDIAPLIGLSPRSPKLFAILDCINRNEHSEGRPLLSAVVINKMKGMPGDGFFNLAEELELHDGSRKREYWKEELRCVHNYWRGH